MNIITATACSNLKRNKSRNILIGIAIFLTAFLLTTVPTVVYDVIDLRFVAVNQVYPTFHAMYRGVNRANAAKMQENAALEDVGLRIDPAVMVCDDPDISISMLWCDDNALTLNRQSLQNGSMPQKADEIVVSKDILTAIGQSGEPGDKITVPFQVWEGNRLGYQQTKEFVISGLLADTKDHKESGRYTAFVSEAFVQEVIPEEKQEYRVYFRLANTQRRSTDSIENECRALADEYGVMKTDVVLNSEYLMANYVDPAVFTGMVLLMLVIIFAGVLTIHSIYYVSMLDKVREFGQLRAIGATKPQIRGLVLREGFVVAAIAVPAGLILGSIVGVGLIFAMLRQGALAEDLLTGYMDEAIRQGTVSLVQPWILLIAALAALVTVYLSLLKPMRTAGRITAIEAIRYQGDSSGKKKKLRKGYAELNVPKLTVSNLGRNSKRTAVTIAALGTTGIFFIVVATILSCMNPETMAKDWIDGDIVLSLDYSVGDQEHPERELNMLQIDNPLSEQLKQQITRMPGVKSVKEDLQVKAFLEEIQENGEPMYVSILEFGEDERKELKKQVKEGSFDSPKLYDGTGVVMTGNYLANYPGGENLNVGATVELKLWDGAVPVKKKFQIVAVLDNDYSSNFAVPEGVLQTLCKTRLTESYHIYTEAKHTEEVTAQLRALVSGQDQIYMDTYAAQYVLAKKAIGFTMYGCYGLLFIFGLIGILNLVNTMINSVHVRRREIGILQAIGLSGRQTVRMFQLEGLFYTVGTLVVSLGIGSLAGYGAFVWAKKNHIMSIKFYHYPVIPAVVLAVIVLLVQLLITYLVSRNFKKMSLIDRIRFAE